MIQQPVSVYARVTNSMLAKNNDASSVSFRMNVKKQESVPPPVSDILRQWYVYMIRCKSGMLYTGITTDVERRFTQHQTGKGAKFLRGKAPLSLVYSAKVGTHSQALKLELNIKKWSKSKKEALISDATKQAL